MINVAISGYCGKMGQVVSRMCGEAGNFNITAGFDVIAPPAGDVPVFSSPMDFTGDADVVIDFSSPKALPALIEFCSARSVPLVLCTTGHSDEDMALIKTASEKIPVFKSGNMSLGINLLSELVKKAAQVLGGNFDVEIIERHHKMKVDAPSGTAFMLADAAASGLPYKPEYKFERHSTREKRSKAEIGISAIRGGTIVGEHEVIFAGPDEIVELRHSALSREVFANGAVAAARFMAGVTAPGMYAMSDVLADVI